jgi:tetratricopeptide (TPR) repeat protein
METRMKNLDGTRDSGPGYRNSIHVRRVPSFELTFAVWLFLTFVTGVASTIAGEGDQALGQSTLIDPASSAESQNSQRLELLRAEISPLKGKEDEGSKDRLKRMIEQVQSIRFESEEQAVNGASPRKTVSSAEPEQSSPTAQPPQPDSQIEMVDQIETKRPYEQVTTKTLKILKDLLQQPDKLRDPLELAEILYASGNPRDAAPFYQEALTRADANDVGASQNRAWILFQMGNCLRNDDPAAAAQVYRQLLVEQPQSVWADPVKAQIELIAWRLKERPRELIAESQRVDDQPN